LERHLEGQEVAQRLLLVHVLLPMSLQLVYLHARRYFVLPELLTLQLLCLMIAALL